MRRSLLRAVMLLPARATSTSKMFYDPARLLPGNTNVKQEQINTPAKIYNSSPKINEIEQRWNNIRATTTMIDQNVNDFLQIDVARLMAIAKAAYAMQAANNAESYRQAVNNLQAILRQP